MGVVTRALLGFCLIATGCSLDWDGLRAGDAAVPDGGLDATPDAPTDAAPDASPPACAVGEPGCPAFEQIDLGSDHGCGIGGGRVLCWGWNDSSQLGAGHGRVVDGAVIVSGLNDVTGVATGHRFTCVVREGGQLWCWGQNFAGQLGRPDGTGRDPQEAIDFPQLRAIDAGRYHVCAVVDDRSVVCWGRNREGQLGAPITVADNSRPTTVMAEGGASLPEVTELALGTSFSCALDSLGTVYCWGSNEFGELGNGRPESGPFHQATVVDLDEPATRIFAGREHACALTESDLYCWGNNRWGQLQLPSDAVRTPEAQGFGGDVRDVALGPRHTCVATSSGSVECYGQDRVGQLGRGTVSGAESDPLRVAGVDDASIVVAGGNGVLATTCAQSTSGALRCWGFTGLGQTATEPPRVSATPLISPVLSGRVFAGYDRSCAWDGDSAASCVGFNDSDELGDGEPFGVRAEGVTPEGVTTLRDIGLGENHTCAIDDAGTLHCWGENGRGQLGVDGGDREIPIAVGAATWEEVDAGNDHTCAIRSDGEVLCWGEGAGGRNGNGTTTRVSTPTPVIDLPSTNAERIALGEAHSCVIVDGDAFCWGRNTLGQLGVSGTDQETAPRQVSGLTPGAVTDLAAGNEHTCAIVSNEVWCWGWNRWGQTGASGSGGPTPARVSGIVGAWRVSAGNHHTCAIDGSEQVVCWGSGTQGRLGRDTDTDREPPVVVPGIPRASELAVGRSHTCVTSNEPAADTVYCFGLGHAGQLGDGVPVHTASPVLTTLSGFE